MTPEQLLREGLAVYGLPADAAAIEGLEEFSRRLLERNQVMNLTAITDPCDVAALHLLDCAYLLTAADFRGSPWWMWVPAPDFRGCPCESWSRTST